MPKWPIVVAVVVVAVWTYFSLPFDLSAARHGRPTIGPAAAYGFVAGAALARAVIVWLVVYLAFLRKYRGGLILLPALSLFAVLGATLVVAGVGASVGRTNAARHLQAVKGTAALRADLRDAYAHLDSGKIIPTHPTAGGQVGEVEGSFRRFLAQLMQDRRAYGAEMRALALAQAITPAGIAPPGGIAAARARIAQARAVVQKYRLLGRDRLLGYRKTLSDIPVSSEQKAGALRGYDRNLPRSLADAETVWDSEDRILAQGGRIVDLLSQTRGHWTVRAGKFVFERPADLARFKAEGQVLDGLIARDHQVQQAQLQRAREGVDLVTLGQ
jgi:hypothetical protein